MDYNFILTRDYIGGLQYLYPPNNNYCERSIYFGFGSRPSPVELYSENPAFYEILECLIDACISHKRLGLYLFGEQLQYVEDLTFSSKQKQDQAVKTCLFVFKNEIDFTTVSWADYPSFGPEKKVKFWKRWLRTRMQRLDFYGYDPYYMFHPDIYDFWCQHEPEMNTYLKEFVRLKGLDQSKVEENLGRKL